VKVIILGQSVTAIKVIEQLRAYEGDAEIIVVCFEDHLPALNERFPELIARQAHRAQALYQNENFFHNLRVEFIQDKKINRINFSRKAIFFEDKSRLEGDVIIIASSEKDCYPDIKGVNKEGVWSLRTLGQVDALLNMMSRIDTVVLESDSFRGVVFAQSLIAQNKDAILCIPSGCLMPGILDKASSDMLIAFVQQTGVRVIRNSSVAEILGEVDVKAARLRAGKVVAAEAVIFPDALPDMRLYNKGDLQVEQCIKTDPLMRTNCEGVFAIDEAACSGFPAGGCFDYDRHRQAQATRITAAILNNAYEEDPIMPHFHFEVAGHEVVLIGDVSGNCTEMMVSISQDGFLAKRIFMKNNIVQGAVLVDNTTIVKNIYDRIITQQVLNPDDEVLMDCQREERAPDLTEDIAGKEVGTNAQNSDTELLRGRSSDQDGMAETGPQA
jgi:nitrite reductase (NADH) large subunit